MVRIVGILCGSALAISLLIIVLGVPEFLPQAEALPEPKELIEATAETENESLAEPPPIPTVEAAAEVIINPVIEATTETLAPPPEPVEHWYAFWSPFRSELAANGFVSQLQRTTGMDYRVVRLKPGIYEVAFAYEAEADIAGKLATISAATGLEMPDG